MKQPARDPLYVTDHAVLRYLERVQGQPIQQVRAHIRKTCEAAYALQATCVRSEGHRFELIGNRVVTVAPDSQQPSKMGRRQSQVKVQR
jgi:2-keto-4-pentenoate hydratase